MKLEIDGIHKINNKDLEKYITKKIGGLDKYLSKHSKKSAHASVKVKEVTVKTKKECVCEVILSLPGERLTAKESTMNMFAAVDIVEEKIKTQLRKYKDAHKRPKVAKIRNFLRGIRTGKKQVL
ncbi:ribosome-associated translation inhibitor RaiA [Candidatus Saccharibacteria bacterium]|nr:ribosome-associated translation inhibitor RaiA [Candidatus Saccharibacteria bacterium]